MANRGDSSSSATSTHLFRITFRWDKKKKKKKRGCGSRRRRNVVKIEFHFWLLHTQSPNQLGCVKPTNLCYVARVDRDEQEIFTDG